MDDSDNATKTTEKAEKIEQHVDGETVVARQLCQQRIGISRSRKYKRKRSGS